MSPIATGRPWRPAPYMDDAWRAGTSRPAGSSAQKGRIPMTAHDFPVDLVVTPDEVVATAGGHRRPAGIVWDDLDPDRIAAIPTLQRLRPP